MRFFPTAIILPLLLCACVYSSDQYGNHPRSSDAKYAIQFWSNRDHCWKAFVYLPDKEGAEKHLNFLHSKKDWVFVGLYQVDEDLTIGGYGEHERYNTTETKLVSLDEVTKSADKPEGNR